jgi:hypothetical protein
MPAYADQAAMEANIEGWVTDNPAALSRLLERASREVDRLFPHLPIRTSGTFAGFRFDPTELLAYEADALERAACYQAEYRFLVVGEEGYAGAGARTVVEEQGPDFRVKYAETASGSSGSGRYSPKLEEPIGVLARWRATGARAGR